MRELTFSKQVNIGKLDAEIAASIGGALEGGKLIGVDGHGSTCVVRITDNTTGGDETTIANLVTAHDPTPPAAPPDKLAQLEARIVALETK